MRVCQHIASAILIFAKGNVIYRVNSIDAPEEKVSGVGAISSDKQRKSGKKKTKTAEVVIRGSKFDWFIQLLKF